MRAVDFIVNTYNSCRGLSLLVLRYGVNFVDVLEYNSDMDHFRLGRRTEDGFFGWHLDQITASTHGVISGYKEREPRLQGGPVSLH
jgi:hypothetical protein